MPTKKVPRKKLLKEPDEFISTTGRILQFLRTHRRPVTIYALIGLVGLIAASAGYYFLLWQEGKAQALQQKGQKLYWEAFFSSSPEKEKENYQKALEQFQKALSFYTRAKTSQISYLYMGHCHFALKDYPQAIASYTRCLSGAYQAMALEGIAHSFEAQGDFPQALENFQKIMNEENHPYLMEAILGVARCYEALQEKAKALEHYEKALAKNPQKGLAEFIRRKISELKG